MLYGYAIIIKKSGEDGSKYPMTEKEIKIGSGPDCHIIIKAPFVSAEHCILEEDSYQVFIKNLSDKTPTLLNGNPLDTKAQLKHGDLIQIGERIIRWEKLPDDFQGETPKTPLKNKSSSKEAGTPVLSLMKTPKSDGEPTLSSKTPQSHRRTPSKATPLITKILPLRKSLQATKLVFSPVDKNRRKSEAIKNLSQENLKAMTNLMGNLNKLNSPIGRQATPIKRLSPAARSCRRGMSMKQPGLVTIREIAKSPFIVENLKTPSPRKTTDVNSDTDTPPEVKTPDGLIENADSPTEVLTPPGSPKLNDVPQTPSGKSIATPLLTNSSTPSEVGTPIKSVDNSLSSNSTEVSPSPSMSPLTPTKEDNAALKAPIKIHLPNENLPSSSSGFLTESSTKTPIKKHIEFASSPSSKSIRESPKSLGKSPKKELTDLRPELELDSQRAKSSPSPKKSARLSNKCLPVADEKALSKTRKVTSLKVANEVKLKQKLLKKAIRIKNKLPLKKGRRNANESEEPGAGPPKPVSAKRVSKRISSKKADNCVEKVEPSSASLKMTPPGQRRERKSVNLMAFYTPDVTASKQKTTAATNKNGGIDLLTSSFDFTQYDGVGNLLKTPKPRKSPRNSLTNVSGVKRLMGKSPKNDLRRVVGLKKLMKTPAAKKSTQRKTKIASDKEKNPKNDLSDVRGVKELFATSHKSPHNDLTNVVGVKELMVPPKPPSAVSPVGVKRILSKSPRNDLRSVPSIRRIFKCPQTKKIAKGVKKSQKKQKSPKNDLTDVRGLKLIFGSDVTQKSPRNTLEDVTGVKELFTSSPTTPVKSPVPKRRQTRGAGTPAPALRATPLRSTRARKIAESVDDVPVTPKRAMKTASEISEDSTKPRQKRTAAASNETSAKTRGRAKAAPQSPPEKDTKSTRNKRKAPVDEQVSVNDGNEKRVRRGRTASKAVSPEKIPTPSVTVVRKGRGRKKATDTASSPKTEPEPKTPSPKARLRSTRNGKKNKVSAPPSPKLTRSRAKLQ